MMPNPPNTSKTAISDEGFTDWLIGEEKVPHEGGKDEDLHVVGEHEVPQEMGEYEGLWQEGAFDKAVAHDTFIEKRVLVEEEAKAGRSAVKHPVPVQQDVCGEDDHPELSDYEKLRERNIKEREEAMKEAMEEINEAKQVMSDNAPRTKEKGVEEGGGRRKKKVESVVELRRSGRKRKTVSYVEEEYLDGRPRKSRRTGHKKTISKPDSPLPLPYSSSCNLRPQKPNNFSSVPEPDAHGFIWCSACNKEMYNGCEKHAPYFKEFHLKVEKSRQGEGVVNRGEVVPKGVLFGPCLGKFNAKTVGYIDPGMHHNPQLHWMTKINCTNKTDTQNLVGFQLAGHIYYRVTVDIPRGEELLVWDGTSYAEETGFAVEIVDRFKGEEDHTEEAIECEYCGTWMVAKKLEEHFGKGGNVYKCVVKQAMEMVRMAESGERKHICRECGKGFKTKRQLSEHGSVHTKVKAFKCDVEYCDKSYAYRCDLSKHKKSVHQGVYFDCAECGKRFGGESNMRRHYKTVHEEEKNYKCYTCGAQFDQNNKLTQHIKTVHEKIRAFMCSKCGKSFGQAGHRKVHMEAVHSHIRYPCTWQGCTWTTVQKALVKFHIRRVHTKEWSFECQLCEDQHDIWWGCIKPSQMNMHKAKKHPVEWEDEQETYRRNNPYTCKYKKCLKRFKTEVEKDRHEYKMHFK